MQVIRTIFWVVVTALLVAFIAMNWGPAPVNFWPLEKGYLHFEWPVGIIALTFFLLGMMPTWLLAKAARWRLHRRIAALENTVRATEVVPPAELAVPQPAGLTPAAPPEDQPGS
ncbi:MAG: LapA family protein [Sphingomonadales bacterium]|nr:LapA family protein [Sphingomonadales bacterium]